MNKFNNIIIDMNNYYHRHYHICNADSSIKNLYKEVGKRTFNGIKSIERKYGTSTSKVFCLFDNHDSKMNLRSELSDDYKKNREKMPDSFYETLEQVKSMILSYKDNYKVVYADCLEADDLVLPLVESFDKYKSVLLVSEDQDWARLIDHQGRDIKWFAKKMIFDKLSYKEKYGYEPSLRTIMMYKAIRGDKSDGISPSLPNMREETVLRICNDFSDVYELVQKAHKCDYISDRFKILIKNNSSDLVRNYKLVSFISLPEMKSTIKDYLYDCSFKEKTLKLYYKVFGIDFRDDLRIIVQEKSSSLFRLDNMPRR